MKIHTINHYNQSGYHSAPSERRVGLYENNVTQGYNVNFSGNSAKESSKVAAKVLKEYIAPRTANLTDEEILRIIKNTKLGKGGKLPNPPKYGEYGDYPNYDSDKLGKSFWDKFLMSHTIDKGNDLFKHNPSIAQAFMALFIAGGLRPATNLAMAGKDDKDDAKYAASHAIASAIIGYIVSSIVLRPFDDAFKDISKRPKVHLKGKEDLLNVSKLGSRTLETSTRWANISQMCKMSFDSILLGIPKAMLTIALIPPILKYVFGMEKKSKIKKNEQPQIQQSQMNFINKPVFQAVKGGIE